MASKGVGTKVLDFFKKAYPFISAGLSVAGPAGNLAANVLKSALSLTDQQAGSPADPALVASALNDITLTPDQRTALAQAEMDYQKAMTEMGYKNAADLYALDVQDRADARKRQLALGGIFPQFLCVLLTGVMVYFLWFLCRYPVPASNASIVYSEFGAIATAWAASVYYFVGSSLGSDKKTDLLSQAPPVQK